MHAVWHNYMIEFIVKIGKNFHELPMICLISASFLVNGISWVLATTTLVSMVPEMVVKASVIFCSCVALSQFCFV